MIRSVPAKSLTTKDLHVKSRKHRSCTINEPPFLPVFRFEDFESSLVSTRRCDFQPEPPLHRQTMKHPSSGVSESGDTYYPIFPLANCNLTAGNPGEHAIVQRVSTRCR